MKKRLLACVLSCLLVLHLSVPALAVDGSDYLEDDIGVLPADTVPEDIVVNPEDYIINSGVSGSSLGLTLSMGQIAALIAGGVGTVYLASNWDALGSHLQMALNEAAELNGGAAALTYWLENARQGVIALHSAPVWIAMTILDTCYNIHQGLSYPQASPLGQYAPVEAGTLIPAGTPIYYGGININQSTGEISRSGQCVFDFDTFVFPFVMYSYGTIYTTYYVFKQEAGVEGSFTKDGVSYSFSSQQSGYLTSDSTGLTRYYVKLGGSFGYSHSTALQNAFNTYVSPGAFLMDKNPWNYSFSLVRPLFESYMQNLAIDGAVPMPDNVSVCPDALVGGISQAWTNDTLGADVIDLPDILIDGTGVITGTDTATLDTSISTTLDKVATGELAWDDYWIDIADSVPIAKVEDTTTGDVVERPIAPDGTLQDPVIVPDWSTDPNDYTMDLTGIFPFCIPFDLFEFLSCLAADPEAPKWTWSLPYLGSSYSFEVDLVAFDDVAQLFRNFELLLFIVGLGLKTRDLIKG